MIDLTGRTAVVCGATSGWGHGAATALAARGANVVVNARDQQRIDGVVTGIRRRGGTAIGYAGGVDARPVAEELFDTAIAEFGAVDILVNSTGLTRSAPALDTTESDWRDVLDVQLDAVFHCTTIAARHMVARGAGGRVITVGGGAAYRPRPGYLAHAASKGAVVAACLTWAAELAAHGITVNVVRGGVRSRGTADVEAELRRARPQARTARDVGLYEPEEAASVVVWLASAESAGHTGLSVGLDGDTLSLWPLVEPRTWTHPGGWSPERIGAQLAQVGAAPPEGVVALLAADPGQRGGHRAG